MIVLITLTGAGTNTGPTFNLFSSINGISFTQIASGISKTTLQAGYTATVANGTTKIRITSIGLCTDSYDSIVIPSSTTTSTTSTTSTTTTLPTTTTSTTTVPPTTTSTTSTTTLCQTPPGLTTAYLIEECYNEGDPTWSFSGSVVEACEAFNYYRGGLDGGDGGPSVKYASLTINETVYRAYSNNCILMYDGSFWFSDGSVSFKTLNQINIVTVLNGIITAIDVCNYVPPTTTSTSTTSTTTIDPSLCLVQGTSTITSNDFTNNIADPCLITGAVYGV